MHLASTKIWDPNEWESHANDLLRERYTSANYITVPDNDQGDGGIEGYSVDGHAYQMYCPENHTTVDQLYIKQRNKMTQDISKFIKNQSKLIKIFGELKIKRWILVVPTHCSKRMNMHATQKSSDILKANLPYVDPTDFKVLIWDQNEFKKEKQQLLSSGLATFELTPINVDDSTLNDFCNESSEYLNNMHRKLEKISNSPRNTKAMCDQLTRSTIKMQNMMSTLRHDYAEGYEQIKKVLADRAEELAVEAFDDEPEARKMKYQFKTLENQLIQNSRLTSDNLKIIAKGTVADWLMNCTLDFT